MNVSNSDILASKILIVDDQVANVTLLERVLEEAGYSHVTSTLDPRETVPMHRKHEYDLILLDLQMPGVDGFEVMARLRAAQPSGYVPVLVITAQPGHKQRALLAGARDFISKPFDLVEVKARIRNMLEIRLLYKKLENHNVLLERAVEARTAELRDSEARFRSLTELASDWYWEQDGAGRLLARRARSPKCLASAWTRRLPQRKPKMAPAGMKRSERSSAARLKRASRFSTSCSAARTPTAPSSGFT